MISTPFDDALTNWSEEIARFVERGTAFAIGLFDLSGQPLYLNAGMCSLLGADEERSPSLDCLANPTFDSLVAAPTTEDVIHRGWLTFGEPGQPYRSLHGEVRRRAGQILVLAECDADGLELIAREISHLNSEITHLQRDLAHETTLLDQTLTELAEANEQLQAISAEKDRFVGMVSHDLRSPIGVIRMACDILLSPEIYMSEEQTHSALVDIRKQANYMLDLIHNLLDVSQIESGMLELETELVDLGIFLRESVSRHTQLAMPKGMRVLLNDPPSAEIEVDPLRLRQVMDNLLSNAVNYSPPGSTIRVTAQRVRSGWRISVQDEGPGISAKDQESLFQYFGRLSKRSQHHVEKGTGLGLAITRKIVEAHGGQVGVDSVPGQGSTFWFTLPG